MQAGIFANGLLNTSEMALPSSPSNERVGAERPDARSVRGYVSYGANIGKREKRKKKK